MIPPPGFDNVVPQPPRVPDHSLPDHSPVVRQDALPGPSRILLGPTFSGTLQYLHDQLRHIPQISFGRPTILSQAQLTMVSVSIFGLPCPFQLPQLHRHRRNRCYVLKYIEQPLTDQAFTIKCYKERYFQGITLPQYLQGESHFHILYISLLLESRYFITSLYCDRI